MPRRKAKPDSARWASIRAALVRALGGCPHKDCFLHAVREVLQTRDGKAALQYRAGLAVIASWRLHGSEYSPDRQELVPRMRGFYCEDSCVTSVDALILDGVVPGDLAVPTDASVRREGEEVPRRTSQSELSAIFIRWIDEVQRWSRRPAASAALVLRVKDGRLIWVGMHVAKWRAPDPIDGA
jgi:hypothetical protein